MKNPLLIIVCILMFLPAADAEVKEYLYDGKEIYVHVEKDHVTTIIFPEPINAVLRGFGADSYVIERKDNAPNTLELMPTDLETAELTVSGISGENYILRLIRKDDFYTKLSILTMDNILEKTEEKPILAPKDNLPDVILEKSVQNKTPQAQPQTLTSNGTSLSSSQQLPPALNLKITLKGNDLPLKVYLSTISQVTGYNIITTPEIDSQHTSINLENIEIWRALKSLLYKFGWGFEVSKEDLIITSSETRIFNIRIPAVDQTFTDETSNESYDSTQNNTASSNTGNQQSQDVMVGTKISYENFAPKLSLWTDLENSIKSIITPRTGTYSISKSSATITITDKPGILDKIAEIINTTNDILSRQQTFEIQIYEVTLSNSNETGVDWGAVETSLKGNNALNLATNFSAVGFTGGQLLSLMGSTSNSGANGVSAVLKALASQGDLHTISKPKITVTNLFPAIIQDVTSIPYISGTGQTISNESTVSNVTTSQVSSGITMRLDAKISEDNKTVLNISVAEDTLDSITNVPVGGNLTIQEPQVSTKSMTTNVEIDPGKTVILGGLISTSKNISSQGIPYLSKIPFLGNAFQYKDNAVTKSELVIVITPKDIVRTLY